MTRDDRSVPGQRYTVGTGNIITGGTITNSPMTNMGGLPGPVQPPRLEQLRAELNRIRGLLEEDHGLSIRVDDRDDAIGAVRALEIEVASAQDGGQADPKGFRWRVRALIGILAPVAEIIGGVAALEAILQHL